jgi:hypothetical protein
MFAIQCKYHHFSVCKHDLAEVLAKGIVEIARTYCPGDVIADWRND